jgi:outer membrane lipoprotein-sorting protein
MSCRKLHGYTGFAQKTHRLWCPECRAARSIDPVIARGVAQLRAEPDSTPGLTSTLEALGLSVAGEAGPGARHGWRTPRPAPAGARRIVAVMGLVALAVALALAFFGRTETTVFAQTMAALRKVRSYHWTGVMEDGGWQQPWEVWYSPGHYREQIGDQTTVDDGIHKRRYKAGSRVVIVDRSNLTGDGPWAQLLQPGDFLSRMGAMKRDNGWRMTINRQTTRTRGGERLDAYELTAISPGKLHGVDFQKSRMVFRVDSGTKLPVSWVVTEWQSGREQLRVRVDRIDYNTAFPASLFDLKAPAGTRELEIDRRPRDQVQLATQTTPRGWKIILHALDLTREGDVLVTVSQVLPAPGGGGSGPQAERPQPDPVPLKELRDDRGTVYADTHNDQIAGTYTVFWLVSPVPPGANGPWPQRCTVAVQVEDGENVTFRDIPVQPPALESVLQLFPVGDPDQVEKIRAAARARRRTVP